MGKLSDSLRAGDSDQLHRAWKETEAAGDYAPLPPGDYIAHIIRGELTKSRTKETPGYKLTFRVLDGEHAGRQFWHDVWLTPAAMPMTKRDLGKIGVTDLQQLEKPLPPGVRCKVQLAKRADDNGVEHNRVRSFEVIGHDPPEQDPLAPVGDDQDDPPSDRADGESVSVSDH